MTIKWQITEKLAEDQVTMSLRDLLAKQWLLPSRFIHFLRVKHHVLVNGHYQYMNQMVNTGDKIDLQFTGEEFRTANSHYLASPNAHLRVLFENRDLLVADKPAGQKSHPNQPLENNTLMNDAQAYLQRQGTNAYMVHRIDQATSGAVIVAKNPIVVPVLDRLISMGQIHRRYLAVVHGQLAKQKGHFDWEIGKDPNDRRKRKVDGVQAQFASTKYEQLASDGQFTLVKLKLLTGRTHQIRVHLAHSGHPIVGDPLYSTDPHGPMLLHGYRQNLVLPFKMTAYQVSDPLPPYFPESLLK